MMVVTTICSERLLMLRRDEKIEDCEQHPDQHQNHEDGTMRQRPEAHP